MLYTGNNNFVTKTIFFHNVEMNNKGISFYLFLVLFYDNYIVSFSSYILGFYFKIYCQECVSFNYNETTACIQKCVVFGVLGSLLASRLSEKTICMLCLVC